MPKTKFTKEMVLSTALDIVKTEGIESITIRRVADRLGSSVAPIYTTYKNREDLMGDVYDFVSREILSFTEKNYTDSHFLNIGIGVLMFAEARTDLFRSYFLSSQSHEIYLLIERNYLKELKNDPYFRYLESEEDAKEMLYKNWMIGLGIALTFINSKEKNIEKHIDYMHKIGGDLFVASKQRRILSTDCRDTITETMEG